MLFFGPGSNPFLIAHAAFNRFEYDLRSSGQIEMRLWGIRQYQLVCALRELEEVVNSFLFHQPRGEIQIAFLVLHYVFPFLEGALDLISRVESREQLLEQVWNLDVLKDAATILARQLPDFGRDGHGI